MSEHLQNIMSMDDSSEPAESGVKNSSGGDRINSLMDMEYDTNQPIHHKMNM